MEPIAFFLNPAAGRRRAGRLDKKLVELFRENGIEVTLDRSTDAGDLEARIVAHCHAGGGDFIVAGGDGSVHEAVNGIMHAGTDTAFGLVPVGTGNDFAKACDIPLDWERAATELAARILSGNSLCRIDVGRMNDRYFANGAGIGFDAKVNRIARKYRWPIGDLVYLVAVLEGLWDGVITPQVTMTWDEQRYSGAVTLANVSNGPWVGGMFHIAPGARNDDGRFDLVFAEPVSRLRVLALLPKLIRGTHLAAAEIHAAPLRRFTLRADAPVPSHLDGEVQPMQSAFDIELVEGAVTVC